MIRVLAVASELYPLVKTGGLADVAGALPAALAGHGVDMRTLVPGYPAVTRQLAAAETVRSYPDLFGGPAKIVAGRAAGLDLLVLDAAHLYDRPGNPYLGPDGADWPDNWRRYAALSYVASEFGRGMVAAFLPDVLHAHDWQAALAAAYLRYADAPKKAGTIVTVHNLAFQGNFGADVFWQTGLPPHAFSVEGVEYYGGISFLKGGLAAADRLTTVSPTYAEEICTPQGGMGLDGLLRARSGVLSGIVNGIDIGVWNPANDASLRAVFGPASLHRRAENRRGVEERFGLERGDGPVLCVISRLTGQKGMDLVAACADGFVAAGARIAVLGSGEHWLENLLGAAAARHPGRVGLVVGYDEPLAHLMQGGSDMILIPSRFEPCGLTQFYGLRYGCVPVVARVGGLNDTIIDANDAALAAGVATGFQFAPVEAWSFARCVEKALALHADAKAWAAIQKRGMKSDVSWERSAGRYAALYRELAPGAST